MIPRYKRACRIGLVAALAGTLIGTTACGVILYPERKGQVNGRIDPAIAVLDGIGLLFFIVPGVIAFAVDFATGAIYLPGSASYTELDMDAADVHSVDAESVDAEAIENLIRERSGESISLLDPALRVKAADGSTWQRLTAAVSAPEYAALTGASMRAAAR